MQASHSKWMGLGLVLTLSMAGCAFVSTRHASAPVSPSRQGHIARIYPTPKRTEMASMPAPNGMMWVLAGHQHVQTLFPLALTHHTVGRGIALNAHTSLVGQVVSGPLFTMQNGSTPQIVWRSPTSGKRTGSLSLPGSAIAATAGQRGDHLYLVCLTAVHRSEVVVVTTGSHPAVSGSWLVPSTTVSLAPLSTGRHVYTLSTTGQVTEWSTASSHQMVSQFSIGQSGRSLVINPAGTTLYVLKGRHHVRNIAVASLATESVLHVLAAPAYSRQIVVSPNGHALYAVVGTATYGNVQEITQ